MEEQLPDLGFPSINYGKLERPWSLLPMLYRGGAAVDNRYIAQRLADRALGHPQIDRIPLLKRLHESIVSKISAGGSRYTTKALIVQIRSFYAWCDTQTESPTAETIERLFLGWSEWLLHRQRIKRELLSRTIAQSAGRLSGLLSEALELKSALLLKTRIVGERPKKKVLGTQADKQKLDKTMAFGRALLDITDGLSTEAIRGPLPILVQFRTKQVIEEWSGLIPVQNLVTFSDPKVSKSSKKKVAATRAAHSADTSMRTRRPVINLRIQAELLIFIAQTGMNLAQAHHLKVGKFSYQSHLGGYRVRRVYKNRKHGEVEFEIYGEYRMVFNRYLSWRAAFFPDVDEDRLFPLISSQGRSDDVAPTFCAIAERCGELGLGMVRPRELRNVRVNWLLRRSGDAELTAEMSQHTPQTLLRDYDRPHHQRALREISRFLSVTDPAIAAPGPVACVQAEPAPEPNISPSAPRPDCASPAGCLFCMHQRDVDSLDHVWSLTTYKYFKSLELAGYRPAVSIMREEHPAALVIERVNAKLREFTLSSDKRAVWVTEAQARIEEGDYHPKWDGFIRLAEATS